MIVSLQAESPPVGHPMWPAGGSDPVRVLLIDDDPDEAPLTRSLLARVKDVRYQMDWVPTYSEGLASIARADYDAFLIDHELGGQTGVDLIREAREAGSLAPLIVLTGHRERTIDLASMNAGATDFLLKGRTNAALLDRTLRYSISQAAKLSALRRHNQTVSPPSASAEAERLSDSGHALDVVQPAVRTGELLEPRRSAVGGRRPSDRISDRVVDAFRPDDARIVFELNDEIFTVTTIADFLASAIPGGQEHNDAVAIFEAGCRAAAVVVRLRCLFEDHPALARLRLGQIS